MPRPRPTLVKSKAVLLLASCLAALAFASVLDTGSARTPDPVPGLETTFSGPAFAGAARGDGPPAMAVHDLEPGQAVSGTVTVRNSGPASRWFWLAQGAVAERLGAGGGRLTDSLQLTVLDVTDVTSPASVYRGPATTLGAHPLGFLAPGATRTYAFTADLPMQRSPLGPGATTEAFRGARADLTYAWHTIAGSPTGPAGTGVAASPRVRRGTVAAHATATSAPVTSPRPRPAAPLDLHFTVPHRQGLLQSATLALGLRCSIRCSVRAGALVSSRGARRSAPVSGAGGTRASRTLAVRLGPKGLELVRGALTAGRAVGIRVTVDARGPRGEHRRARHTVRLLPRR